MRSHTPRNFGIGINLGSGPRDRFLVGRTIIRKTRAARLESSNTRPPWTIPMGPCANLKFYRHQKCREDSPKEFADTMRIPFACFSRDVTFPRGAMFNLSNYRDGKFRGGHALIRFTRSVFQLRTGEREMCILQNTLITH